MPDNPPFREPCNDKPMPGCGHGPQFKHGQTDKRDVHTNSTAVPNFNTDIGGTIPPYERPKPDDGGGAGCEIFSCNTDPNNPPCSQWLLPFPENTFTHTPGDTIDFKVCHKADFKNVQARRFWNGAWGFKNPEPSNGPTSTASCGDCPTLKKWRGYTAAVNSIKYTTITIEAEDQEQQLNYDVDCNPTASQVNWDEKASVTQTIDPTSGLISISGLSVSPNEYLNPLTGTLNRALGDIAEFGFMTWNTIVAMFANNERSPFTEFGHIDCTDNSITVWEDDGSNPPWKTEESIWDLAAGTFQRKLYHDAGGDLDAQTTVSVTGSSLSYNQIINTYGGSCGNGQLTSAFVTVTSTLGGENTSASIYADIKENLLSLWPLNDDALYPWRRNDSKVSVAPLVSRDEIFTTTFGGDFFAKDYGSPIADAGGATIGDAGWSGNCGVIINPDPNTGTMVQAIPLNVSSGDVVDITVGGFAFTTATGYSMSGTLPTGVTFDSSTGHISGTASVTGHYGVTVTVTGASPLVTGNILGAPRPAGYQNYFDFGYRDWRGCCFTSLVDGAITWSWYQTGWGMNVSTFNSLAGCSLPLNATQWTNFFQSVNKPQGAFLFYNDPRLDYWPPDCHSHDDSPSGVLEGGALWVGKYAECLETWPSQNFAMPAGDAKFWFDETQVFCATNISGSGEGSTWTLVDTIGGTPPDSTDFIGIWGGASVDGFYSVGSYSGGTLTLGAKQFDVPSNWASKSNGDEAKCFGKLRWPTQSSLLGRIAITPDMAGTTFTFATPQPDFGMSAAFHEEQVDLWDGNMVSVASNVTATRVDDSTFTTTSSHSTAKYVTITGTAKWYVNDSGPKGDYAVLEWLADLRSIGEWIRLNGVTDCSGQVAQPANNVGGGPVTQPFAAFSQTAGCLGFTQCEPRVVCISPNGETWRNGATYPFPESFACDEQYGSKWWGFVQSHMTDLLWQAPHRPCNIEPCAHWKKDDGSCQPNVPGTCPGDDDYISDSETPPPTFYYGHEPQAEVRLTVPNNYGPGQDESAPIPPAGIQVGWLSPALFTVGDIAFPPVAPGASSSTGAPAGVETAWSLHATFCGSAADGCRFNYQLPGC